MNTLNNENIIYVPNTLDGENIVSSHLEENALLIDGTNQMLANLNAGNHRVTQVSNAISATDAVNKSQLDLKADTTYVDGNFVNKTSSNTQSISGKLSLTNATTDIFTNPIIQFTNTNITPLNQGQFIRFLKGVSQQPNLEIGGLSFCSNNFSTTLRRQADLICSMNSNTYPEINLKFNDGTINPLTINYGNFISRNNKQYFQKQDGTNIFNYLDYLDYVAFSKDISLGNNNIINLASGSNANDAVNKSQLDLKADTTYVDTNFLNKTTSTTQIVNSNLDMNTTNKIINLASGSNANDAVNKSQLDLKADTTYLDTNFINKTTTSTQDVKGKLVFDDISQDIITFQNNLATASNGMRLLFKKNVVTHPFLYVGGFTWADLNSGGSVRRMVEMAISNDGSTMPVFSMIMNTGAFTPVIINTTQTTLRNKEFYFINQQDSSNILTYLNSTNKIKMYKELDCANIISTGNLSCVNLTTTGNQVLGTNSTNSLDVKSSTSFEADVLIEGNEHLMLGGNPTSTGGMRLIYDASFQTNGTAYIDSRATSLKIRLTTISDPTTDRVEINNSATTIKNNLIVEGNTTLGNSPTGDTCTFNCQATFPADSKLTFDTGSYIDSARIRIIPSGNSSFQLNTTNVENGVYCDNTSPITITMPNKNTYWNDRHYIIKVLSQDVDIDPPTGVTIDNSTSTINVGGSYRSFQFVFTSDFSTTGKIFIIGDK
jgi:hypothetical protein